MPQAGFCVHKCVQVAVYAPQAALGGRGLLQRRWPIFTPAEQRHAFGKSGCFTPNVKSVMCLEPSSLPEVTRVQSKSPSYEYPSPSETTRGRRGLADGAAVYGEGEGLGEGGAVGMRH